jgi:hypothetical protein
VHRCHVFDPCEHVWKPRSEGWAKRYGLAINAVGSWSVGIVLSISKPSIDWDHSSVFWWHTLFRGFVYTCWYNHAPVRISNDRYPKACNSICCFFYVYLQWHLVLCKKLRIWIRLEKTAIQCVYKTCVHWIYGINISVKICKAYSTCIIV